MFPSGNFKFSPPSNKTKQTKRPTIVSSPCPKSKGSTNPKPDLPINNPESNKITTLGNPVKEENNRAQAPANTAVSYTHLTLPTILRV